MVAWGLRWGVGREGRITKWQEETFGSDRHVHFLDYDDGFTVHTWVKILQIVEFKYVWLTAK